MISFIKGEKAIQNYFALYEKVIGHMRPGRFGHLFSP